MRLVIVIAIVVISAIAIFDVLLILGCAKLERMRENDEKKKLWNNRK